MAARGVAGWLADKSGHVAVEQLARAF